MEPFLRSITVPCVSRSLAVSIRRCAKGIQIAGRRRNWTSDEEALVGTIPDEELAHKLGRTPAAIEVRRAKLGRPKRTGFSAPRPTARLPNASVAPNMPSSQDGWYCAPQL